jgi:hypothetical protein
MVLTMLRLLILVIIITSSPYVVQLAAPPVETLPAGHMEVCAAPPRQKKPAGQGLQLSLLGSW